MLLAELNNPVTPFLLTGGNSAEQVARIAPTVKDKKTNELDFVQLTGSREVMKLDGGMMGVALGGSWYKQKLDADNPDECKTGTVAGLNCFFAVGDQTNTAFYAEINAPVLKSLELNAAIRYDHYDTYGGQWTPKVGAKWTPMEGSRHPRHMGQGVPRARTDRERRRRFTLWFQCDQGPGTVPGEPPRRQARSQFSP